MQIYFAFKQNCRVYGAFKRKRWIKGGRNEQILGCSFCVAKQHIESFFKHDMSWDNYGLIWEIDHIYPLALANTPEEMEKLCHYTNLQPLYVSENRSKGKKVIIKKEGN